MLALQDNFSFTVKDVPAGAFVKAYSEYLKKNDKVVVPAWIEFAKTGVGKELSPEDPNWLYTRIAAVARKIYLRPHLGVGTLQHLFGGKRKHGVRRPHHCTSAGKILRYSLQQLEKLGVVSRDKKYSIKKFSRVITPQGQKELDIIASNIGKEIYKRK